MRGRLGKGKAALLAADTGCSGSAASLYNERPAWLANAHRELDEAVAAAYGWPYDLVVYPLNQCKLRDGGDPEAAGWPMTSAAAPNERMPVIVPVGRGSCDGVLDLAPSLEAAPLQGQ